VPVIPYVRATHSVSGTWTAAKANVVEDGVNDAHYMPAVRAFHNTTQGTTNGTFLTLAFNSERFDQAGNAASTMHDNATNNSRLTARHAGIFFISANLTWAANTAGDRQLYLRLNAATDIARISGSPNPSTDLGQEVSTLYALAVNDFVEARAWQSSGGALNVSSAEIMMVRVA
jgi:hypothetical protein